MISWKLDLDNGPRFMCGEIALLTLRGALIDEGLLNCLYFMRKEMDEKVIANKSLHYLKEALYLK